MNKVFSKFSKSLPVPASGKLFSAVITFANNIIFGRIFNSRSRRGPLFVTWLVTFDCNAYCSFCATHVLKKRYREDISLERARSIAHEIGQAGTWVVGFTGGEVLLWPHLYEVIEILKSYNIIVYIVTNGYLLKEMADKIIASKVDSITVSLDSSSANEHDSLRNLDNLFARTMEGVESIKEKRHNGRPVIKSTTVLSRKNLENITAIIEDLGEIVDITSIQPISSGYANNPHGQNQGVMESFMFQPPEKEEVDRKIAELIRKFPEYNTGYIRNMSDYWFNPVSLEEKIRCWSPFLRLQILPNGDVFHCLANDKMKVLGNLKSESIMQIWNSPEMVKQRECIRKHENHCICWTQDSSFNALMESMRFPNKLPKFRLKNVV